MIIKKERNPKAEKLEPGPHVPPDLPKDDSSKSFEMRGAEMLYKFKKLAEISMIQVALFES